ncbi:MAG: mercury(II) reductase [Promethearchaeota archaeon]
MTEHDLVILGGGAAGFAAAIRADEMGKRALMVDDDALGLGGTCVNVGCVPTKFLVGVARRLKHLREPGVPGLKVPAGGLDFGFDYSEVQAAMEELVTTLRTEKYEGVVEALPGVDLVRGRGHFPSADQLAVGGETFEADRVVVATGSRAKLPPVPGLTAEELGDRLLTHVELLRLKRVPSHLLVLGAGPQGLELAQAFARFGSHVDVLELLPKFLPAEEPELASLLLHYLNEERVNVHLGVRVTKAGLAPSGGDRGVELLAEVGGREVTFRGSHVLVATGRSANSSGLGLEARGVELGRDGSVRVDGSMRASRTTPTWAAGDVTGGPLLETVAAKEGWAAATNALSDGGAPVVVDNSGVPRTTFTDPPLSSAGLTDAEANETGITCACTTVPFKAIPRARVDLDPRGAIKMVANARSHEVLGVHVLATSAPELIHEAAVVVAARWTIEQVIRLTHVFPTRAEAIKLAALSFTRDVDKLSCCVV